MSSTLTQKDQCTLATFLGLFLFAASGSQTLLDAFATLLGLYVLFLFFVRKRGVQNFRDLSRSFASSFLIWLVVIILGLAVNQVPIESSIQHIWEFRWFLEFLFLLFSITSIDLNERITRKISFWYLIAFLYAIVIYFLRYSPLHEGKNMIAANSYPFYRTGGFYNQAMPFGHIYGMFAAFLGGITVLKFQNERGPLKNKLWWLVLFGLNFICVIFSFTRGVWIGLAVAIPLMTFFVRPRILIYISLIGAFCFFGFYNFNSTFKNRIEHTLHRTNSADDDRIWIWKANFEIFKDHPLLGVGYSENTTVTPAYYEKLQAPKNTLVSHAHNQYLQWLAGTGLLGLGCYLYFVGLIMLHTFRAFRLHKDHWLKGLALGAFGAQIVFAIGSMTEANFSVAKTRFVFLFFMALGESLYVRRSQVN